MTHNNYTDILIKEIGMLSMMISGSKTGYHKMKPKNLPVFNSNIIINGEKVWYGDIDLSLSKVKLQTIAVNENVDIYVIYEHDGRFENEDKPLLDRPVAIYKRNGTVKYNEFVDIKKYNGL